MKSLINFKSKAKHNTNSLHIDKGKVTSDLLEICNNFNKNFTTIAGKIDKKNCQNKSKLKLLSVK